MAKTAANNNTTVKADEVHPLVKIATRMRENESTINIKFGAEVEKWVTRWKKEIEMNKSVDMAIMAEALVGDNTETSKNMKAILLELNAVGINGTIIVSHEPLFGAMSELQRAGLIEDYKTLLKNDAHEPTPERECVLTETGREVARLLLEFDIIRSPIARRY